MPGFQTIWKFFAARAARREATGRYDCSRRRCEPAPEARQTPILAIRAAEGRGRRCRCGAMLGRPDASGSRRPRRRPRRERPARTFACSRGQSVWRRAWPMSRRGRPSNVTLGGFGAHVGDLRLARRQAGDGWTRRPQSVVIGFVEHSGGAPDHSGEYDVRLELLDLRDGLAEIAAACVERHVDLVQHLAAHLHHQVGHDTVRLVRIYVVRSDHQEPLAINLKQIAGQLKRILIWASARVDAVRRILEPFIEGRIKRMPRNASTAGIVTFRELDM